MMLHFNYLYVQNYNGSRQEFNHRILPTRKYLYNIKQIPSPLCNFCQEQESISLMLWSCQENQSLIGQFIRWLTSKNIILTLVRKLFIFNIGNTNLLSDLQIIMVVKYYIYITKYLNQQLSLIALKNKIIFSCTRIVCSNKK